MKHLAGGSSSVQGGFIMKVASFVVLHRWNQWPVAISLANITAHCNYYGCI
jgi:hypothetical protein